MYIAECFAVYGAVLGLREDVVIHYAWLKEHSNILVNENMFR